jgi:hypothetical protein
MRDPFQDVDSETYAKFLAYHKANPDIWKAFRDYALQAARARKRYSAKTIMERIRWDREITTRGTFKISNSFTSYYARAFVRAFPQHGHLFRFKPTKGLKWAA